MPIYGRLILVLSAEEKKGKDVDLHSAFHAPGTANAHVTETGPSDRYLGHHQGHREFPF